MFDFSPYSAVLLDLDGTIYHEHEVLPGAVELVAYLRATGQKFACLTNSNDSPSQVSQRLASMGMDVPSAHIYTASAAAADFVVQQLAITARPRIFNLASAGLAELLQPHVDWVISTDQPCDAVLSGAPTSEFATEARQWMALQILRKGAKLIALCADRVFPSPRGIEFGSGALAAMLGYAAQVQPTFCGKPEALFFNELCNRLEVNAGSCILIGDNLESDIGGAKGVGMAGILVLSGVTRQSDIANIASEKRPDTIVESLSELL